MLNGNVFAVYTKEDDIIGLHAIAEKIPMNYSLVGYTKGCKTFNVCKTWKEAQKLAKLWNESFWNNKSQKIKVF